MVDLRLWGERDIRGTLALCAQANRNHAWPARAHCMALEPANGLRGFVGDEQDERKVHWSTRNSNICNLTWGMP